MIGIYQAQIEVAKNLSNDSAKLGFLTSILRSVLQVSAITSLELVKKLTPIEDLTLEEHIIRFRKPADGMPLTIIDQITPYLRSHCDRNFFHGWFEKKNGFSTTLFADLQQWVEFRNARPGHGVVDEKITTEWAVKTLDLIEKCLDVLQISIPSFGEQSKLRVSLNKQEYVVDVPLVYENHAYVVLGVNQRKSGWKLKAHLLSYSQAKDITVDLTESNIFACSDAKKDKYQIVIITNDKEEHILQHNAPVRQTEIFEGRSDELELLKDWLEDTDSRRCLIYGDGGYGKTTLVLELINQLLESSIDLKSNVPGLIFYYTAKMTRWTSDGLKYLSSVSPVIEQSVRELMHCVYQVLSKDWYSMEGRALIDRAATELKKNGHCRNDILIIIDNTETLATTSREARELARLIDYIGKTVGRVIITSRRQEAIEAKQILVEGLTIEDSVSLLRSLATEAKAKPIIQAGDAKLRKVAEKLMRKPILLETLVAHIARANVGIDQAIDKLYQKSHDELLEFLYEDAWVRMGELQKRVFYVLVSVGCPLEQYSISRACQLIEVQHSEFQNSLVETHFATMTDYGSHYELELVGLAKQFFIKKLGESPEQTKKDIQRISEEVDSYSKQRYEIEILYKRDRVAEAFRTEYAKHAKISAEQGRISDAIEYYKAAIDEDPVNAALHDRFAWFLLNKTKELTYALEISQKAVELNTSNCDAVVTLALIHYRLGNLQSGDTYIDKSIELGRPKSFALLRKGIARIFEGHNLLANENRTNAFKMFEKSLDLLQQAERVHRNNDGYDAKNLKDIIKYQDIARGKIFSLKMASRQREASY